MTTDYRGIDYGMGTTNVDQATGIRYGVINQHEVLQAWADSSESNYGSPEFEHADCPECGYNDGETNLAWGSTLECEECGHSYEVELPDCAEPISWFVDDGEYLAECSSDDGDIFITKSPYYSRSQFCSPCAPGAGYLMNECPTGEKTYCFGHNWFEDNKAPYTVYRVSDDTIVLP